MQRVLVALGPESPRRPRPGSRRERERSRRPGSPRLGAVLCHPVPAFSVQIVAQKKMTRPLLLKLGRTAGKSSITVRPTSGPSSLCGSGAGWGQGSRPGLGSLDLQEACSPAGPLPQVVAEDISGNNGYVELSFQARKLDDKVRWAPMARPAPRPPQGLCTSHGHFLSRDTHDPT